MIIQNFVTQFAVMPADAIILNKKFFGMVDHYVIYLGIMDHDHRFVANYIDGVKIIPNTEIDNLLQSYVLTKVEKFPGPNDERGKAIKRALSRIGEKTYNYVLNNCEHFKNFVHHGIKKSTQVERAGVGFMMAGIGVSLSGLGNKNSKMTNWGIFVFAIGLILMLLENSGKKKNSMH